MSALTLVHGSAARVHRTPNAEMTTLAAPSVGSCEVAMWRLRMRPGAAGPAHSVDHEQILTVLAGAVRVEHDGRAVDVAPGDALILPAGVTRRISVRGVDVVEALVASTVGAHASTEGDGDRGPLPWAS